MIQRGQQLLYANRWRTEQSTTGDLRPNRRDVRLRASRSALPPLRHRRSAPRSSARSARNGAATGVRAASRNGEIIGDCVLSPVAAERPGRSRHRHRPRAAAGHQAPVRPLPVQRRAAPGQRRGPPPREVATEIVAELEIADLCEPPEIAGPGFINFRLRTEVLAAAVTDQLADPSVGIVPAEHSATVVIDYSAPNVAKQMHVGHLRSTIIGDCLNRVLTAVGHRVIPQNHIGDWGTQFGMLVEQILRRGPRRLDLDLAGGRGALQAGQRALPGRPGLRRPGPAAGGRAAVRRRGDPADLAAADRHLAGRLQRRVRPARRAAHRRRPGRRVDLQRRPGLGGRRAGGVGHRGDRRRRAVRLRRGLQRADDRAQVPTAATATRPPTWPPSGTGSATCTPTGSSTSSTRPRPTTSTRSSRSPGWPASCPTTCRTEHVAFGRCSAPTASRSRPARARRSPLNALLDTAEEQAAPPIALAAIKYADLSNGLNKDYVFDVDRMVQTTGNTGPYLQYAHARMTQVLRKAEAEGYGEQTKVAGAGRAGRADAGAAAHPVRRGRSTRWPTRCSRTGCAPTSTSWPARCRSSTSSARC